MIIIYHTHTQISSHSPTLDSRIEKNESIRKKEKNREREKNERKPGKAFIHLFIDFIDKDYK